MKKHDISFLSASQDLNNKINSLYRLAEFGRLSAGVFHDLMSPLTVVSLNLEQLIKIKTKKDLSAHKISKIRQQLEQALVATKKMEGLILCIKHHLNRTEIKTFFDLEEEINIAIKILSYQAIKNNTKIIFKNKLFKKQYYGNPVKFNQIIYNLLSNAIQSCSRQEKGKQREVVILLDKQAEKYIIEVSDCGPGIKKHHLEKIFLPFFSTKKSCGLGLYITKRLTEKDFSGKIETSSQLNKKTVFSIILPVNNLNKGAINYDKNNDIIK